MTDLTRVFRAVFVLIVVILRPALGRFRSDFAAFLVQ